MAFAVLSANGTVTYSLSMQTDILNLLVNNSVITIVQATVKFNC